MKSGRERTRNGAGKRNGFIAPLICTFGIAAIILTSVSISRVDGDGDVSASQRGLAPAETPYRNPRILFSSYRDGDWEICVVHADGTELKKLTDNSFDDRAAAWSPDGEKILFFSDRDGENELYVMNADGMQQRRLTHVDGYRIMFPCWSPDGRQIAFTSARKPRDSNEARQWQEKEGTDGFHMELYVMNADGSGLKRLTERPAPSIDFIPFWSPDGKKITYTSIRDGNYEVYVMNSDGSGQENLTNDPARDGGGMWSADGRKLLFASDRSGESDVYVMNTDGTGQKRLTFSLGGGFGCEWSPDGTKIAYVSAHKPKEEGGRGNGEIRVINADGGEPRRLTFDQALDRYPRWSPDGKRIAYESYSGDGNIDIYVIDPDGRNRRQLTDHSTRNVGPCWSPIVPVSTDDGQDSR